MGTVVKSRRGSMGASLMPGTLVSVDADGAVTRHAVGEMPVDGTPWIALESALRTARSDGSADSVSIALHAPHVEVRGIALPPLAEEEAVQLLSRAGGRYFLGARGVQVVGVGAIAAKGEQRMAAAASSRLVTAVEAAAKSAGFADIVLVPAEAAWASATAQFWPARARGGAAVIIADPSRIVVVETHAGAMTAVRRFRGGVHDVTAIAAVLRAMKGDVAIAVVGPEPVRAELVAALAAIGVPMQPLPADWAALAADPVALAARCADLVTAPRLASIATRMANQDRVRRFGWVVAAVAAGVFLLAAGTELWGTHREIAAVEQARDVIRPAVEATLVGRTSMEDAYRRLAEVVATQRSAPIWSGVLGDMAGRIPDDAYLTGFRARGDSLVIDGFAVSASRVFDALTESPVLESVRASAPVRRQAPDGDAMERFAIGALRRAAPLGGTP